jgi:hypothetical protein
LGAKMHLRTTNVLRPSQSGEIRGRDTVPVVCPEAWIVPVAARASVFTAGLTSVPWVAGAVLEASG